MQDQSPLGYEYTAETISPSVCLVPILRSGLSMVDALQSLLPDPVSVHHLGMYREKTTLQPVEYYNNLPYHKAGDESSKVPELAIIVDPIIATGSTVCAAIDTLRDWGVPRILSISVLPLGKTKRSPGMSVWLYSLLVESMRPTMRVPLRT